MKLVKQISGFLLVLVLTFCINTPIYADAMSTSAGPYEVYAWNKTAVNGNYKALQGHGNQVVMTVNTLDYSNSVWTWGAGIHGNYILQNVTTPYELVNITRVLQYDTYYNCRGYWYDSSTNGRDQRLVQIGSYIRLADPLVSGTWYLQTDKSSPSSSSNVIFYTGTGLKAQWNPQDTNYN